jgi:predicted dehydrogenase
MASMEGTPRMAAALNVAIAGFGWWGKHIARRLVDHPRFTVEMLVEPVVENHAEIAAMGLRPVTSLDEALASEAVEAVILTTPNRLHEEQTTAAAAAGKHVFCEKPLALSADGARRMVAACEAAGLVLGIGHERRFEPALQRLAALVAAGELGTVMHAEAAFSHDKLAGVAVGDWRTMKATAPAAAMTGMGIHITDLYISMFGPVDLVQAITADRVLGWETGDVVTAQFRFKAGMTATLSAILKTPHFIRTHVFGSQRWVEVRNDTHPDTPGGIAELVLAETGRDAVVERYEWTDTVVVNLEAFAAAVRGEAAYPYTHAEMVHNIELLEAIARSAETGETVRLG